MKRKLTKALALLLALCLLLSACGSGAASVASEPSSAAAESASAPEETPEVSEESAPPEETVAPEVTEEPEETTEPEEEPTEPESMIEPDGEEPAERDGLKSARTSSDFITYSEVKEIKASIRESVTKEYLEPNNIAPEAFQWPTDKAAWSYLSDLLTGLYDTQSTQETLEAYFPDGAPSASEGDQAIIYATFKGITNWLDTFEGFDSSCINYIRASFDPLSETISSIDVTEP